MSAALYAARKGLDVAIIGAKVGGQMTYTGSVDNYLGSLMSSGAICQRCFRAHFEKIPGFRGFRERGHRCPQGGRYFCGQFGGWKEVHR